MKQSNNQIIELLETVIMFYGLFKLASLAISEYKAYRAKKARQKERAMLQLQEQQLAFQQSQQQQAQQKTPEVQVNELNKFPKKKERQPNTVELDVSDLQQQEYVPEIETVKDINDVKDIETLYSYLMYLRSQMPKGKLSEIGVSLLVHEASTFISTRMIDLREARGLICTDGISLLQFTGEELKPTGFVLTKIKSIKSIPSRLFENNVNRFHKMWDRASWNWIIKGGPRRLRGVFFNKRKWALQQVAERFANNDFEFRYDIGISTSDPKDFLHDPAVYLRVENDYHFTDSMDKIISSIIEKDIRRFDQTKTIVGVSDLGETFVVYTEPLTKMFRLIPFFVLKKAKRSAKQQGGLKLLQCFEKDISKIDGHIERLLSYSGNTVVDRTLGLRFFEI